ncbi:FadR/GntR family transcriptional regulator [Galactobacter valiniphilus]|uniref:FadR/GntR family transcriptional regulator n=1 Tax=Galactobacter valiniphilus TaxID=2676122 RepID=UPI0037360895
MTSPTRGSAVLSTLRSRLKDGTWPVGTRLPGEHELAAELGVGRNTVREALRTLVNAGLLTARRGDGTYVIATDELEAALARRVDSEEAHRVLEVRGALEIETARLAATRATEADLADLRALLAERTDATARHDDAAFLRADLAFHEAVARASGNELLLELYLGVDRAATYARERRPGGATPGKAAPDKAAPATSPPEPHALVWATEDVHRDHDLLLDAITARDPEAAAAAARHLIEASHRILDSPGAHTASTDHSERTA